MGWSGLLLYYIAWSRTFFESHDRQDLFLSTSLNIFGTLQVGGQGLFPSSLLLRSIKDMLMEEIRLTTWDLYTTLVNHGINYQPQLVSRIPEPSTVGLQMVTIGAFKEVKLHQPSNSIAVVQGAKVAKAMKMEKTKVFLTSVHTLSWLGRYQG